ncbi:MAG: septal ring lytic transglycosylase RlpA family protein [Methyloceanibacter sp.]
MLHLLQQNFLLSKQRNDRGTQVVALRYLPCDWYPKTGRKVAVRVNDRGPFTPGVMLDLSSGAAEAIGMRSTQSVTMSRC